MLSLDRKGHWEGFSYKDLVIWRIEGRVAIENDSFLTNRQYTFEKDDLLATKPLELTVFRPNEPALDNLRENRFQTVGNQRNKQVEMNTEEDLIHKKVFSKN